MEGKGKRKRRYLDLYGLGGQHRPVVGNGADSEERQSAALGELSVLRSWRLEFTMVHAKDVMR